MMNDGKEIHNETDADSVDVVVIGGGVTGLAAAWTAGEAGKKTVLLESGSRLGGSVLTHVDRGYTIEGGPHALLVQERELEDFLRGIGIWDQATEAAPSARKRFVVRNGRPAALPFSLKSFLTGSFLSPMGKLRLLAEPFLHGKAPVGEEALGPWVERHFGKEVREGLADPFVSGIFAGDPEKVSLQAAFPALADTVSLHPSVIRAFLKKAKQRKKEDGERYGRKMISFPGGLAGLVGHLSRKGPFETRVEVRLERLEREPEAWNLRYRSGSDPELRTLRAAKLLVCVPPSALPDLPFDSDISEKLTPFREVESPPVTTCAVAFAREDVSHPLDGFGILAPSRENRDVLGILFDSSLFPDRAPEGQVLLSAFLGGARYPDDARLDTETLLRKVEKECRDLLGAKGEAVYYKTTYWPRAIPQYNLGYLSRISVLEQLGEDHPGLGFAGNSLDGVSLGNCLLSGVRRMKAVLG